MKKKKLLKTIVLVETVCFFFASVIIIYFFKQKPSPSKAKFRRRLPDYHKMAHTDTPFLFYGVSIIIYYKARVYSGEE